MRPLIVPPRDLTDAADEAIGSPAARLDLIPVKAANENSASGNTAPIHWPANKDQRTPLAPPVRGRPLWRLAALLTALMAHGALAASLWAYLHQAPPQLPRAEDQAIVIEMVSIAAPAAVTSPAPSDPVVQPAAKPELAAPAQAEPHPQSQMAERLRQDAEAPSRAVPHPSPRAAQTDRPAAKSTARHDPPAKPKRQRLAAAATNANTVESTPPAARSGDNSQRSTMDYAARIAAHLMRHKRQPGGNERAGRVSVAFSLDRTGRLISASIAAAGAANLNEAALATVRSAAPFPAPPADVRKLTFVVPIRFTE